MLAVFISSVIETRESAQTAEVKKIDRLSTRLSSVQCQCKKGTEFVSNVPSYYSTLTKSSYNSLHKLYRKYFQFRSNLINVFL